MSTNAKQKPQAPFISEQEISLSRVGRAIERFINTEGFDEEMGGLLYEDTLDWPIWISVDHDDQYIILKTCRVADIFANGSEAMNWVNAANEQMGLVQFHIADGRIWGRRWISYVDGLNIPKLIETMQRFSASFVAGVMIQLDHA
jgi:hypothetical protein